MTRLDGPLDLYRPDRRCDSSGGAGGGAGGPTAATEDETGWKKNEDVASDAGQK